jgi:hypothetical protein
MPFAKIDNHAKFPSNRFNDYKIKNVPTFFKNVTIFFLHRF